MLDQRREASLVRIGTLTPDYWTRERFPGVLDALLVGSQVLVGVAQEVLEQALHAVRAGERRDRVAVEELRDGLASWR